LRRERPLAHLHGAIGNGLIVIQAPAGSGKTALAMQFADELDFSVAWVALKDRLLTSRSRRARSCA